MRTKTFADLKIGEYFKFTTKTNVGCGKYNATMRKTSHTTYRGNCFTGVPELNVQVISCV